MITGFYFDYSSGAPCIPGSSVKGVIRSIVKNAEFSIEYLCPERMATILKTYSSSQYKTFVEALFGRDPSNHKSYETNETSIYDRIIFLDSYAIDALSSTKKNKVFSEDFLAPHKDNQVHSLLSNPIVVRFLKVVPQVIFDFSFMIPKALQCDDDTFYREDILHLIQQAILQVGVGAKSNVGYGHLECLPEYERKSRNRDSSVLEATRKLLGELKEKKLSYEIFIKDFSLYKGGSTIEMTILEVKDEIVYIQNGEDILPSKTLRSVEKRFVKEIENEKNKDKEHFKIKAGNPVLVRINRDFTLTDQNFTIIPKWK